MKRIVPALSVLVFFLAGLALIPWPGLQNDELFFAGPIYAADAAFYNIEIGSLKIPAMVMSYTGALKTWLYAGLFQFVAPNEWTVRIPVLLMGMATIWLTWVWVRRAVGNSGAGDRAAGIAAILLATDAMFQLTNTFDWGPVALQHILLMGGLVALGGWLRRESAWKLALAFFLWGLGMWDKALLAWPLGGLLIAAVCVYPRETVRRAARVKPALTALIAFLLGALPLVWYNIDHFGETAASNARFSADDVGRKVSALRQAADGSAVFGYMVYRGDPEYGRRPPNAVGRISASISSWAGDHHQNAMAPAYMAALLLSVLLWRSPVRRLLLFVLIATGIAWAQMALNKGTGGAPHHAILLWPFPAIFLAIVFSEIAGRIPRYGPAVLTVLVAFLAAENLLNVNEYLAAFAVNGGAGGWTDAIFALSNSVEKSPATDWYGLVDWGCLNQLRLLHEGDLPLFVAQVPAAGVTPSEADLSEIRREIEAPDRVFIQHTDDKQMFPGVNGRWRDVTARLGYREVVERVIHDRNGRPVFELYRLRKAE
jgi:hypothetical protein